MTTTATSTTFELVGPLQARVMELLWQHGAQTVQQVADALNAKATGRPLAYTTFLTVMRNLARRKLVSQTATGRAHTFEPLVTAESYRAQLMAYMRRTYFADNDAHLTAAMRDAAAL